MFVVVVDAWCLDLGLDYVVNGYVNMVCVFVCRFGLMICFWI